MRSYHLVRANWSACFSNMAKGMEHWAGWKESHSTCEWAPGLPCSPKSCFYTGIGTCLVLLNVFGFGFLEGRKGGKEEGRKEPFFGKCFLIQQASFLKKGWASLPGFAESIALKPVQKGWPQAECSDPAKFPGHVPSYSTFFVFSHV